MDSVLIYIEISNYEMYSYVLDLLQSKVKWK